MKKQFLAMLMIATMAAPVAIPAEASAQHRSRNDYRWQGDQKNWEPSRHYHRGNYRERRLTRRDRIYRGRDGRAYCRRSDGTTGLVIGAIGGAVLANAVGGGTLETLLGAGGGALLGRESDRCKLKCR